MNTQIDNKELRQMFDDTNLDVPTRIIAGDMLRFQLANNLSEAEDVAQEVIDLGLDYLAHTFDKGIYDAIERAHITRSFNHFHDFLIALEWDRPLKEQFYQPRMRVMRKVTDAMTDMIALDKHDILMVSMPPRVGKSSLGLFFIAWIIGRNPTDPILATGYAANITKMFYDGVAEVFDNPEYNYRKIFPKIDLVNRSAEGLMLDFRNDGQKLRRKYKTLTCRAIDGSLTGATEARQLLYCDDLVRDIEEALNPNRLMALREKLVSNAQSRKKQGCKELHIGTRWSVHDPLGWVERQHEGNPRCKVIRIPALDPDTGESNFVYDFGVGFDTAHYEEVKRNEDDVTWQCMYQQMPIEREGLLFPADELTYMYALPDENLGEPDDTFAFCDVAWGGKDYLSMPIAKQWGNDIYIVDVVFMKGGFDDTMPVVGGTLVSHNVARAVFERNNGGEMYAKDIKLLCQSLNHPIMIRDVLAPSTKSKETRIIQHSPTISKFIFLHPSVAPQPYRTFMTNLTTYTSSGKNMNDDAPDSLAGLAAMMRTNLNAKVQVFDRRAI